MNRPGNLSICSCILWSAETAFPYFVAYDDARQSTNNTYTVIKWNATGGRSPWVTTGHVTADTIIEYVVVGSGSGGGRQNADVNADAACRHIGDSRTELQGMSEDDVPLRTPTSPILPIIANRVNEPSPVGFGATHTGNEGFYHGRSISTHNPAWRGEDCNSGRSGEVTT